MKSYGSGFVFTDCRETILGRGYRGKINITKSGRTCQYWNTQDPHLHNRYGMLSDKLTARNYCRNPDNEDDGPWCYTTDPLCRWEYCDVPMCV